MIIYSSVDPCQPKAVRFVVATSDKSLVHPLFARKVRAVYHGVGRPFVSLYDENAHRFAGRDVQDIIGYLETGSEEFLGE